MAREPRPRPLTWRDVVNRMARINELAQEIQAMPRVPRAAREKLAELRRLTDGDLRAGRR